MLYYVWFAVLYVASIALSMASSAAHGAARGAGDPFAERFLMSLAASVLAVGALWEPALLPFYRWLKVVLPQAGTDINDLTATILTIVAIIGLWALAPAAGFAIWHSMDLRRERASGVESGGASG